MAVELAQAYVSITPSARGIGRSLARELNGPLASAGATAGDRAASGFGSRFVSALGRIGRTAGLALTAGLGTAGFFGIRVAADFEQTRIAFEGILGDVDKATALLGDLRDFAAKTPFEFTGLTDSAKQLLAVGFSAEDIIPTMTTLGNVAATLGVGEGEIAGVVRALGQMKGKGRASAEELQQISEQIPGFSAINAIADELGITTAEAFDQMRVGAIDADTAIEAILDGMESFPGAAGAMDRQSKTLNGVISTFKDTLSGIAIDFITPYLPALSAGVQKVSGWIQDIADDLKGFLASSGFQQFKDTVQGFIDDGLQGIADWWDRNGETVIGGLTAAFEDIGGFATTAGRFIRDELMGPLETFATWLFDNGPGAELIIAGLAAAFGVWAFNAALAAAATALTFAPLIIGAVLVAALAWATQELIDRFDLLPKASTVFQWITDHVLVPFIDRVHDAIETVKDLIDLVEKIPEAGSTLFGGTPLGPLLGIAGQFGDGGVVGGPLGAPRLILAHGGETVFPTHKAPLPALAAANGDTNIYVTQVPGEDAGDAVTRGLRKVRLTAAA